MIKSFSTRCCAVLALCVIAGTAMAQSSGATGSSGAGSAQLSQTMKSGMDHMSQMQTTGDPDKDFAMMMKVHHQQAVDMAKIEVEQGKSPELKSMAQKIIKDQQQEINKLDTWLKKHP